jgi:hypothetical protein
MYPIRNYPDDYESSEPTESSESTPTISDTTGSGSDIDSDTDSEYEYEMYQPEMENVFDMIYYDDVEFLDTEKENGHYYIGLYEYIRSQSELILGTTVSPKIYYKYTCNVSRYLRAYSIVRNKYSTKNIHIMQLKIDTHNTYTVIIKTYWIRLIQRHWKKIFKMRMDFIQLRKRLSNQRHFELNGRYILGNNIFPPSLIGMLEMYNNKLIKC